MADRSSEDEVLALVDDAERQGTAIHGSVVRTTFATLAEDYERVIHFIQHRQMLDEFEEAMLLLFRAHCERATGRLDGAIRSIERSAAVPGRFVDGWIGWQRGLAHLQLGDPDAAVSKFHASRAFDELLPFVSERAYVSWFCALVSERRDAHENAAMLLGFADRVSNEASVGLQAFDRRLVDEARARVRECLGAERDDELSRIGRETAWEDLPLVDGVDDRLGPRS